ncbi:hypothetical protein HDU67_002175 [Dinochytrium kinnereticum]|nr:hypothetical protein HDU67_002175 [Dinochytrium kinnereticum]
MSSSSQFNPDDFINAAGQPSVENMQQLNPQEVIAVYARALERSQRAVSLPQYTSPVNQLPTAAQLKKKADIDRHTKAKLPEFKGEQTLSAIQEFTQRMDRHIAEGRRLNIIDPDDEERIVLDCSKGIAASWWSKISKHLPSHYEPGWEGLKELMLEEFLPEGADERNRERLRQLRHSKGPVARFNKLFRDVFAETSTPDNDRSVIRDYLEALPQELRIEVKRDHRNDPDAAKSLTETMRLAEEADLILFDNGRGKRGGDKAAGWERSTYDNKAGYSSRKTDYRDRPNHNFSGFSQRSDPMDVDSARMPRRLDDRTHAECMSKGLCFRCREPGHQAAECTRFDSDKPTSRDRRRRGDDKGKTRTKSTKVRTTDVKGKARAKDTSSEDDSSRYVEGKSPLRTQTPDFPVT